MKENPYRKKMPAHGGQTLPGRLKGPSSSYEHSLRFDLRLHNECAPAEATVDASQQLSMPLDIKEKIEAAIQTGNW